MIRSTARSLSVALALLAPAALLGCGESAQEKAKAQVCSARSEISKQVEKLEGLKLSTNAPTEVKDSFEAISKSLSQIRSAQPNLEPARRAQVEAANAAFTTQLTSIANSVTTKLGSASPLSLLSSAEPALKTAATQLGEAYKRALGPIPCS